MLYSNESSFYYEFNYVFIISLSCKMKDFNGFLKMFRLSVSVKYTGLTAGRKPKIIQMNPGDKKFISTIIIAISIYTVKCQLNVVFFRIRPSRKKSAR